MPIIFIFPYEFILLTFAGGLFNAIYTPHKAINKILNCSIA